MHWHRCMLSERVGISARLLILLTRASLLSLLNRSLVGLRTSLSSSTEQTRGSLERTLQVARSRLAPDPDLGHVGFQCVLQWQNRLDDKRVGVSHVEMHESDHSATHQDTASGFGDLGKVVVTAGGGDELARFLRHGVLGVDVLDDGKVVGFFNSDGAVVVDGQAEELDSDVTGTCVCDVLWLIVERDSLGDLHGAEHEGLCREKKEE